MAVLKVEEWKGASGLWYVADTHTWTGWRACAEILDVDTYEDYIEVLQTKYHANVRGGLGWDGREYKNVMFSWPNSGYKNAHQFKLDINRIARKKNYLV